MNRSFNLRRLAWLGARFHWRSHASVALGTAVASSVLIGAMLVGDSVKASLRAFALMRLGETRHAMDTRNRYFASALADRLGEAAQVRSAAALALRGIALHQPAGEPESRQVNHVQVLGVDGRFWRLSDWPDAALTDDEAAVSEKLARALGVKVGDEIGLRVGKPSLMPRDAPLASRKEALSKRGSFRVKRIVPDAEGGRFSLEANQVAPNNVFVSLGWLQRTLGVPDRANVLLVGPSTSGGVDTTGDGLTNALRRVWDLAHVGLSLRALPGRDVAQLESDRVFLDPETARAALERPDADAPAPVGVLAYLVNVVGAASDPARRTPYSFVVAANPSADRQLSPVPVGMRDDQIVVNRWLADGIRVAAGDVVKLSYLHIAPTGQFEERSREFTVHSVVEMDALADERQLMPHFPGLTDVDKCSQWDIGMPMDETMLNDKTNEDYWQRYRATPKAVVTLAAGQAMWGNRFGDLSSVRYRVGAGDLDALRARLGRGIRPDRVGLFFLPVREQALRAVDQAMSFGELFLSMSFFLIVAALMLTGLLFVFGVQQRAEEMGALLAIGYRARHVRRVLLGEGAWVAALGTALGAVVGTQYTRALIWGLGTHWQGAVAGAAIRYHATWGTILEGAVSSFVIAVGAMAVAMWRQARRPARELLAADLTQERDVAAARAGWLGLALSWVGAVAGVGIVAAALLGAAERHASMAFFAAGALLLIAGIGFARYALQRRAAGGARRLALSGLGRRNAARRRGRSLTAIGLLACGCFMVLAVSSMQEDVRAHADRRWSGTGGFALYGESTLRTPDDLNGAKARETFRLGDAALTGVSYVCIKAHDGDDASCFNLNRAQAPRLLGVDPALLERIGAFTADGASADDSPWRLIQATNLPPDVVPGLAGDSNTAMWNLMKKVGPETGDALAYKDERGNLFKVRLVGTLPVRLSVFQGVVLVPMSEFARRFPSEDGYRVFLVDVSAGADAAAVRATLARKLERIGLDLSPSADRLAAFNAVESTYLAMFLVLGGLGLLLGSIGMGVVVLRNVLERREELAILRCVGFSRGEVARMVAAEHRFLLAVGVGVGAVSSLVAVSPSLVSSGVDVPVGLWVSFLAGTFALGFLWIGLATRLALRGDPLRALRKE